MLLIFVQFIKLLGVNRFVIFIRRRKCVTRWSFHENNVRIGGLIP